MLETVAQDRDSKRRTDWGERDLAIILTALLAGLRADELCRADIGDIRVTADGAGVIHVKGKGGKERSVPIEAELLSVITTYLASAPHGSPALRSAKSKPKALRYHDGPRGPRSSSAAMANGLPVAHCSRASRGRSDGRVQMHNQSPVRLSTDCAIPTPPNWPAPTSASTP